MVYLVKLKDGKLAMAWIRDPADYPLGQIIGPMPEGEKPEWMKLDQNGVPFVDADLKKAIIKDTQDREKKERDKADKHKTLTIARIEAAKTIDDLKNILKDLVEVVT